MKDERWKMRDKRWEIREERCYRRDLDKVLVKNAAVASFISHLNVAERKRSIGQLWALVTDDKIIGKFWKFIRWWSRPWTNISLIFIDLSGKLELQELKYAATFEHFQREADARSWWIIKLRLVGKNCEKSQWQTVITTACWPILKELRLQLWPQNRKKWTHLLEKMKSRRITRYRPLLKRRARVTGVGKKFKKSPVMQRYSDRIPSNFQPSAINAGRDP